MPASSCAFAPCPGARAAARSRLPVAVIHGAVLLVWSSLAFGAAEWFAEPRIYAEVFHDDNVQLTVTDPKSVTGLVLTPSLTVSRLTESSRVAVSADVPFRQYPGDQSLDSTDLDLRLDSQHRTERDTLDLDARYIRDTTLTSEIEDLGRVTENRRREKTSVGPSWTHRLSDETRVGLAYEFTDVRYDAPPDEFLDYDIHDLRASVFHRLSRDTELRASLGGGRYRWSQLDADTDVVHATVGVVHRLSDTLEGRVDVGARWTDSSAPSPLGDVDDAGLLVYAGLVNRLEFTTLRGSYRRYLVPTSAGVLNEEDRITVDAEHRMSPDVTVAIHSYVLRSRSATYSGLVPDRDQANIRPQVEWQIDRNWAMGAYYQYLWRKFDGASDSADSHRVGLYAFYNWDRIALPF